MTTCVHTAQLNAHLKREDELQAEQEYKEQQEAEKVAELYEELDNKGFIVVGKNKALGTDIRFNALDVVCNASELQAEDISNVIMQAAKEDERIMDILLDCLRAQV